MIVYLNLQTAALIVYFTLSPSFVYFNSPKYSSENFSFKSSQLFSNIFVQTLLFCSVCCHWCNKKYQVKKRKKKRKRQTTYRGKSCQVKPQQVRYSIYGMGILLYIRWTATSVCHMCCNGSESFDEVIVIAEALPFIRFLSERKVNEFVNAKTQFITTGNTWKM